MTNSELKSKVLTLGNKLATKGQDRSVAFKRAWNEVFFDSLDFAMANVDITAQPKRKLVLDMRFPADRGKLFGMMEYERKTGLSYSFSVRL